MPAHQQSVFLLTIASAIAVGLCLPASAQTLTFHPAEELHDERVHALAVADFDGDGARDLIACTPGWYPGLFISVWHNERDGTFSKITLAEVSSISDVYSIAVGDIDNDGDRDAVHTIHHPLLAAPPSAPGLKLRIFRNDGDMEFGIVNRDVGEFQTKVVIADIDRAGSLDFAVLAVPVGLLEGNLRVLPAGGGNLNYSHAGSAMAAGDVDGDGDVDLMSASSPEESGLWLWRNRGYDVFIGWLGFEKIPVADVSQLIFDLKLARLDGDSDLDAVLYGADGTVTVMRNNGSSFSAVDTFVAYPIFDPHGATGVGDVDEDGDIDLVIVEQNGNVRCYLNNGDANFTTSRLAGVVPVSRLAAVEIADIDDDTDLDILVGCGRGLFVLRNRRFDCGLFGGSLGDFPCADSCRFRWAGADGALTDPAAWTPTPSGTAEDGDLILHNDGVPTNVATLGQPFGACQMSVAGLDATQRQYVQIDAGGDLDMSSGVSIEAHGVVRLNGGTMTANDAEHIADDTVDISVDGEISGAGALAGLYGVSGLLAADHNATLTVTSNQNVFVTETGRIEVGQDGVLDLDTQGGLNSLGEIAVEAGGLLDVSGLGTVAIANGGSLSSYAVMTVDGGAVATPDTKQIQNASSGVIESIGDSTFHTDIVNHGYMKIDPGSGTSPGDTATTVNGCIENTVTDPRSTGVDILDNATLRVECFSGDAAVGGGELCVGCPPPPGVLEPLLNGTLVVEDDLSLAPAASLMLPRGTVKVGGDVDIAIDEGERFDLSGGVLQLNGFFYDGPQHLELMSPDMGATVPEGVAEARVLGELILGPSPTDIVLVDNHDNSGTGTGETIYARDLRIETGAVVDLAGAKVYYETLTVDDPDQQVIDSVGGGTLAAFEIVSCGAEPLAGLFGPVTTYGPGGGAVLAAGDVDGDGTTDLVTDQAVFRNNGDGTYQLASLLDSGNTASAIALADLDMDGDLDLVAANRGAYSSACACYAGSVLFVLRNDGSGVFGNAWPYPVGVQPESLALGDLNGDEFLDVVVASHQSDALSVLLNNGDGTLAPRVVYETPPGAWCVALGDMDDDGDLDAVVSSDQHSSVFLNAGLGALSLLDPHVGPPLPRSIALGDVDGDQRLDVVASHPELDLVSVMINDGSGALTVGPLYGTGPRPGGVAFGDIDGDADLDLVVTSTMCDTVSVLENTGLTFTSRGVEHTGTGALTIVLARLDCNGSPDLALSSTDPSVGVSVLLDVFDSCPADFNGDGTVGFADLTELLNHWGSCGPCCAWDLDRNGDIGFGDLTQLLAEWGPCA